MIRSFACFLHAQKSGLRSYSHVSVLLEETVRAWNFDNERSVNNEPQRYVDCTLGGGGHSILLLRNNPTARVLGLDLDADAVAGARAAAARAGVAERLTTCQGSYKDIVRHLQAVSWPSAVHGIVADLGVSSHQLDTASRGFSLRTDRDGPLDMRFAASAASSASDEQAGATGAATSARSTTAAELVNKLPQAELARIFEVYGEERWSAAIASAICGRRAMKPFHSTADLATCISGVVIGKQKGSKSSSGSSTGSGSGVHPATRCFQALRIAVNDELRAVESLLATAPGLLVVGGRFSVITFHSLEDRLVKTCFNELTRRGSSSGGKRYASMFGSAGYAAAGEQELNANPRSRSAKLRGIQRMA